MGPKFSGWKFDFPIGQKTQKKSRRRKVQGENAVKPKAKNKEEIKRVRENAEKPKARSSPPARAQQRLTP